jgi:hypothetical protein
MDALVVSLDPGFNGTASLSSNDMTTLKENAVHAWHLHTRDIQSKNSGIFSIKYTDMHIYEHRHHGGTTAVKLHPRLNSEDGLCASQDALLLILTHFPRKRKKKLHPG